MESILRHLKDPSWWFSVVFVGFMISFFAPWVRKVLVNMLSNVSSSMAKKAEDSRQRTMERIDRLSKDPNSLLTHLVFTTLLLELMAFCIIFLFLIPIIIDAGLRMDTHAWQTVSMMERIWMLAALVGALCVGLVGIATSFFVPKFIDIAIRAYRKRKEIN